MKRFRVISLLILAGFCTAGIARAQERVVSANVPFDFAVSSKHLPSGNYQFLTQSSGTILVRGDSQQFFVLATADLPGSSNSDKSGWLVFHKYGDSYFLREIHCPNIGLNEDLPQSKQEKQLHQHLAWLGPDTVLLALNGN
jgi:hypothetical protein